MLIYMAVSRNVKNDCSQSSYATELCLVSILEALVLTFSAARTTTYWEEKISSTISVIYPKFKYTRPSVYVLLAWYNYSYKIEEVEMGRTRRSSV